MAASNVDKLYYTRSDGPVDTHKRRLSPTRSNYLPAASEYQYAEIVRRPLAQESYYQSVDQNRLTPPNRTQRQEGDRGHSRLREGDSRLLEGDRGHSRLREGDSRLLEGDRGHSRLREGDSRLREGDRGPSRLQEGAQGHSRLQEGDRGRRRPQDATTDQRFSEPIKWVFDEDNAEAYSRAIQWGCVKDRGLKKTLKELEHASIITDDDSEGGEIVRGYLAEAKTNNDPTCLLKAYTVESQFYKGLNEYMASGKRTEVFKKLRRKWSGYYTGMIMRNPAFKDYHFRGITYRGMQVTPDQVEKYEVGVALANKAFQSTSRSRAFALTFACPEERKPGTKPVIIVYTILDKRSALYIRSLSDYPEEEEVLLVPGTLFITDSVDKSKEPYVFQLRQLEWNE